MYIHVCLYVMCKCIISLCIKIHDFRLSYPVATVLGFHLEDLVAANPSILVVILHKEAT